MKVRISGKYGRATSSEMMELLGLKRTANLPKEAMPERLIQGVRVYVKPQRVLLPGERKSSSHRIFAICECGQHVPTGRLHQHKCKGEEEPREENPRQKGDDDGVEYGHPADRKAGNE